MLRTATAAIKNKVNNLTTNLTLVIYMISLTGFKDYSLMNKLLSVSRLKLIFDSLFLFYGYLVRNKLKF